MHERAILAEHIGLRSDLLEIFRQHAKHIGGEDVIAEFRPFLRLLLGEISQAVARMHHQDGWALAGYAVVVGHIGFELGVAVDSCAASVTGATVDCFAVATTGSASAISSSSVLIAFRSRAT